MRYLVTSSILSAAISLACVAVGSVTPATAAPAKAMPRLSNGKPDLNGTWDNGSGIDFIKPVTMPDGSICVSGCMPPPSAEPAAAPPARLPPDRPRYKPQFVEKVKELEQRQVEMDPVLRCKSPGLPRIGPPDKIVQTLKEIVFLYDDVSGGFFRIIPLGNQGHRDDVDESYLGDSVGRWEGDTLVIDTVNFNDDSWLTDDGAFHTTNLRVTETLRRDGDVIEWQAIAEDPQVLAEPWKLRPRRMVLTAVELAEAVPCIEQDLKHVVDGTHHDNPR